MQLSCKNDLATFWAILGKLGNFYFIIWSHWPQEHFSTSNFLTDMLMSLLHLYARFAVLDNFLTDSENCH